MFEVELNDDVTPRRIKCFNRSSLAVLYNLRFVFARNYKLHTNIFAAAATQPEI